VYNALAMRSRFVALTFFLFILVGSSLSQDQQSTREELARKVQHLMDIQVGFMNAVPPGISIEAKEISRTGKSGDLVVKYHVFLKGAPPDSIFRWLNWPVNAEKPSVPLEGITAGKDGLLMCAGRTEYQCGEPKKPDDPIDFITNPRKGEPYRFAFIAGELKVGLVIVPDPIESKDKSCTLSAVRLMPKFELAFISGSGYPPNTDIHYRVSSPDKSNDFVIKSTEQGVIRTGVVPFSGGKSKGTVKVKILETTCSPAVAYEWGTI
jgi:hypothetical protein